MSLVYWGQYMLKNFNDFWQFTNVAGSLFIFIFTHLVILCTLLYGALSKIWRKSGLKLWNVCARYAFGRVSCLLTCLKFYTVLPCLFSLGFNMMPGFGTDNQSQGFKKPCSPEDHTYDVYCAKIPLNTTEVCLEAFWLHNLSLIFVFVNATSVFSL